MRKDFSNVNYRSKHSTVKAENNTSFVTAEQIEIKPLYTPNDTKHFEHLNFGAGIPPFLRRPYSSMYVQSPWTSRHYAGFIKAE
ncbi:MAG: methylmalonyl-CoA mutase family protein, partial [Sphingobacteriaceae bacterium]